MTKETSTIIIPAYQYNNKKEADGSSITNIDGLGINGTGVTTLPFTSKPYTKEVINKAPYIAARFTNLQF